MRTLDLPSASASITEILAHRELTPGVPSTRETVRVSIGVFQALLGNALGPSWSTKAQLDLDLDWEANTVGFVWNDTDLLNGVYKKSGASGTGAWTRIAALPYARIVGILPRGAWVTATAYDALDIVSNNGASYLAIGGHTSGASTEPGIGVDWEDQWVLLAARGAAAGVQVTFDSLTADSDPGAGDLRANNGTLSSATKLYIDNSDRFGVAINALLDSFDDAGGATDRGRLRVESRDDPSQWLVFKVTGNIVDGTGYRKIDVTYIAGSATFAAGEFLVLNFYASGAAGALAGDAAVRMPSVRLSLTSGVDVPPSDVASSANIYVRHPGLLLLPLYDSSAFVNRAVALENTLALLAANITAGDHFTVFAAYVSGAVVYGTGPAWTANATPGTGAGTAEIEWYQGYPVNKNIITLKNGATSYTNIPARQALMLGAFRCKVAGEAIDTAAQRFLCSYWNPAPRAMTKILTAAGNPSHTYSVAAYRHVGANADSVMEYFSLGGFSFDAHIRMSCKTNAAQQTFSQVFVGLGLDSTTVNSGDSLTAYVGGDFYVPIESDIWRGEALPGLARIWGLEWGGGVTAGVTNVETWLVGRMRGTIWG